MEAGVGIERFMLCFPSKFSQHFADSQGYSAPTGTYLHEPIYYPSTEAFTEGHTASCRLSHVVTLAFRSLLTRVFPASQFMANGSKQKPLEPSSRGGGVQR